MKAYFEAVVPEPFRAFTWQYLLAEEVGDTLLLTLDNAERRNALNPTLLNELAYALAYAAYKREIRFVRLRAAGGYFCSGADLGAFFRQEPTRSTVPTSAKPIVIYELLSAFEKPLIAEVVGHVLAGGFLLITGATFVVAHEGVRFSLPEVRRGLFPFQVLKALSAFVPSRIVLGWCLTAAELSAADLYRYGVVTHLVPTAEAVASATEALLETLRRGAPLALSEGIAAYHRLEQLTHEALYERLLALLQTKDAQEGLRAFREKREPKWMSE